MLSLTLPGKMFTIAVCIQYICIEVRIMNVQLFTVAIQLISIKFRPGT